MSKILDKIEKLLALAQSPNEHEAQAALEKAQRLAIENNIDLARELGSKPEGKFIKECENMTEAANFFRQILDKHFQVRTVRSKQEWGEVLYFVGTEENCDIARRIFRFLDFKFKQLWRDKRKQQALRDVKSLREQYFQGLAHGLSEKLDENKARVEQEILHLSEKQSYAMVVVSQKAALSAATQQLFPNLTRGRTLTTAKGDIYFQGRSDGRQIEINNKRLN